MSRPYTYEEIESMRQALNFICTPPNVSYYPEQKIKEVEEKLRTYILAGTEPAEIYAQMQRISQLYQNR